MITVNYKVYSTYWHIHKVLKTLVDTPLMSFDIETKGVYTKQERKQALDLLKNEELDITNHKLCSLVGNNSGLSFPSLIKVTHFIFGISKDSSIILIPGSDREETFIWNWLKNYKGKLLIHNTLFDLKVMYHRIQALPLDYEDTALMAKNLINNAETWRSKVGLKELMGDYYDPAWTLIDEYEPDNVHDPKFLRYSSIDGAATYYLYELIVEQINNAKQ